MARMIPSVISPEVKSNAERRIFEWFRDDPETEGWVVLHSLGIANHRTVIYGELDFFVIAPKLGIFGIEVKGGRVKRENGVWSFTDKYGKTSSKKRGPFEQANEGTYSLIDSIKLKKGVHHALSNLLFGSGVMFPDITFNVDSIDVEQWQIFDQNDGRNVSGFIRRLAKNSRKKWEEKYGILEEERLPDSKSVRELINILRGDFDKAISLSTQINYAEEALITLTEEQLKCLDQLEDNPRCLVLGSAGTGKTLLAIEEVKKSVIKGEKVAFFCYNSMLGNWLKNYFRAIDNSFEPYFIGTFHSFLNTIVMSANMDICYPCDSEIAAFYRDEMPILALEAIEKSAVYVDRVIIDEAQDLLNEDYLDVIDSILRGGLTRGKWNMFGDFEMQAIYNTIDSSDKMKSLLEEKTSFIKYKLRINCRNTKPIGNEIKFITGFDNSQYLWTKIEGPPVNYITYSTITEQKSKLEDLLLQLETQKIKKGLITILSPIKRENSVVNLIDRYVIKEYLPGDNDFISFSTIQSFKGLENSIIILTDINTFEHEKLMYVGLSRARAALFIFESEQADKERNRLLVRWL